MLLTKTCTRCQETKAVTEFGRASNINSTTVSYYNSRCKKCAAQIARERRILDGGKASRQATAKWRKANPGWAAKSVQDHRLVRVKNQFAFLLAHPCVVCGETDPIKLELDHIIPLNSAKIPRLQSWTRKDQTMPTSADNIQVLCANCHRVKTHRERNSVRWRVYSSLVEQGILP